MSVFTALLSDALLSAITPSVCHPSVCLCSPNSHLLLFSINSPNCITLCEALLCFPDCFISLAHSSIYSLFSAVSSAALLCFSSSDPTLEHLREIRRKLASENLQLKAPVPHLLSRSQLGNRKTFRASSSLSEDRDVSQRVSGLAV